MQPCRRTFPAADMQRIPQCGMGGGGSSQEAGDGRRALQRGRSSYSSRQPAPCTPAAEWPAPLRPRLSPTLASATTGSAAPWRWAPAQSSSDACKGLVALRYLNPSASGSMSILLLRAGCPVSLQRRLVSDTVVRILASGGRRHCDGDSAAWRAGCGAHRRHHGGWRCSENQTCRGGGDLRSLCVTDGPYSECA